MALLVHIHYELLIQFLSIMGIQSCRFEGKIHEEFLCNIFDVSCDPVAVNDCENIFYRKCISNDGVVKCPICQESFEDTNGTI